MLSRVTQFLTVSFHNVFVLCQNIPPQYGPAYPLIDKDNKVASKVQHVQNIVDGKDGWWDLDNVSTTASSSC